VSALAFKLACQAEASILIPIIFLLWEIASGYNWINGNVMHASRRLPRSHALIDLAEAGLPLAGH